MGRLLLALLVGLVGALIVHIGVIFAMPQVTENNAWARLSQAMPPFRATVVYAGGLSEAPLTPGGERFAFMDPAFIAAACRFTIADGPVRLNAEAPRTFWSASIYSRAGDNLYSINERVALDGAFDLVVGTQAQFEQARIEGESGYEDAIPVVVTSNELYLTLRTLVESESRRPFAEAFARSVRCAPLDASAAGNPARG
ncbi:DUF1254 domain-containing protein [Aureimonas mangrovi]|uniref:DUF1254 domain-containing protein n=1 Tax=Aureimonas mangrovi TaxID=2758041 RepID=UPI00163DDB67|nr:hypothetical protein [Aureimonas mangrovi]